MKNTFKPALVVLLICGVIGADEVNSVSVMEGDSVTLNPNLAQIQGFLEIEWQFKDQPIAYTHGGKFTYSEDERFRDRLQLNQTGSLTITNMRTNHSGVFQLLIELNTGPLHVDFPVTVYESPAVINPDKGEMKFESVKEGDPVTLQTDVTDPHGDELIVWRFGEEGKLIAKADTEAKSSPLYYDERFRDRLKIENNTGSLIITNTRTTDSGLYTVKISSKQTLCKEFTVIVSGPGWATGDKVLLGIVVVFVLVAVAIVGVFYLPHKISELQKQKWVLILSNLVTPKESLDIFSSATSSSDFCLFLSGTVSKPLSMAGLTTVLYTFALILAVSVPVQEEDDVTLEPTSKINEEPVPVSVTEGEDVPLKPNSKINKADVIQWQFGVEKQQIPIAEIRGEPRETATYDKAADGRFRDRLYLDETTGSLAIKNSRPEHSGLYKLEIRSSSGDSLQAFTVTVKEKVELKSVEDGGSVTLNPDTEIQRDDQILWMFGDQDNLIAQIKEGTGEKYDGADGRFRDRLQLDEMTASMTITNITPLHTGLYKLQTISSRVTLYKKFRVFIQ